MAEQKTQNFENHVRNDPKIYASLFISLLILIMGVVDFFVDTNLAMVTVPLIAINLLLIGLMARLYSVSVQDRIIMMESRLRLERVLDESLKARIPELTRSQLVAIRFESDEKVGELVQKVLDDKLAKATEIKKLVQDWQADFHRV